jgi:Fe-S cluster assembly protein SufD
MNTTASGHAPVERLLQAGLPGADEPQWLREIRGEGGRQAGALALPTRQQEDWRYTPTGFFEETVFEPASASFDALQLSDIEELLLDQSDHVRLVFVNGRLAPGLSSGIAQTAGVEIRHLGDRLGSPSAALRERLDRIAEKRHVFAALNTALMSDGLLLRVGAEAPQPPQIEVLHVSVGMEEPAVFHPRHLIVLEEGAQAGLIERYCALGDGHYFNNALIEVSLAANSRLDHMRSQEESPNAQHLSDLHVHIGAGADYRLVNTALGAAWSRSDVRVALAGEQASARLDGLMFARDRQLNDVHLDIRHEVPHCTSRETFKGILDGKERVVFDGHILVAKDAQKTDAVLSNDNLMLSRSAEVDTKPQLEIYADDVKCSHGTTVGELDGDMLFYLRSRGISEARAKQMLCHGFAEQVLEGIAHPSLRTRLERALARRLGELG